MQNAVGADDPGRPAPLPKEGELSRSDWGGGLVPSPYSLVPISHILTFLHENNTLINFCFIPIYIYIWKLCMFVCFFLKLTFLRAFRVIRNMILCMFFVCFCMFLYDKLSNAIQFYVVCPCAVTCGLKIRPSVLRFHQKSVVGPFGFYGLEGISFVFQFAAEYRFVDKHRSENKKTASRF